MVWILASFLGILSRFVQGLACARESVRKSKKYISQNALESHALKKCQFNKRLKKCKDIRISC